MKTSFEIGQTLGKYTVISAESKSRIILKCSCGKEQEYKESYLLKNNPKSCFNCFLKEKSKSAEEKAERKRLWYIKRKYSLDPAELDKLLARECPICKRKLRETTQTRGQKSESIAIDHDHSSGKVRGILCSRCNKGLGHFEDSIKLLREAIKYLEKNQ